MDKFKKNLDDLFERFDLCNKLIVKYETKSSAGVAASVYQIRNAFSHFVGAYRKEDQGQPDDKIEEAFEQSCSHLNRAIHDLAELCILKAIERLDKGVRFVLPKTISEAYPKYYEDYNSLIDYREKLEIYKVTKSSAISDLKAVTELAEEALKIRETFDRNVKLMRKMSKRHLIYATCGFLATAGVTALITYFCTKG